MSHAIRLANLVIAKSILYFPPSSQISKDLLYYMTKVQDATLVGTNTAAI